MMFGIRPAKIHGLAHTRSTWIYEQAHRRPDKVSIVIHIKPANGRLIYGLLVVHGLTNPRAQHNTGSELFQSAHIRSNGTEMPNRARA
jgi:hypothetical protein